MTTTTGAVRTTPRKHPENLVGRWPYITGDVAERAMDGLATPTKHRLRQRVVSMISGLMYEAASWTDEREPTERLRFAQELLANRSAYREPLGEGGSGEMHRNRFTEAGMKAMARHLRVSYLPTQLIGAEKLRLADRPSDETAGDLASRGHELPESFWQEPEPAIKPEDGGDVPVLLHGQEPEPRVSTGNTHPITAGEALLMLCRHFDVAPAISPFQDYKLDVDRTLVRLARKVER
jgi:hypothetical protein